MALTSFNQIPDKFRDPIWGGEQLSLMPIFKRLTREELVALYEYGRFVLVKPLSHAIIEGEPSKGLYVILEGTMSVYKTDPEKQSLSRLAVIESGSYFGEFSLFDNAPRSATVTAESTCHCFVLEQDPFQEFLLKMGDSVQARFYRTCAEVIVERFRLLNADYMTSQHQLWKHAFRLADQKA